MLFSNLLITSLVLLLAGKYIYKKISNNIEISKPSISLEYSLYLLIGYLFLSILSYGLLNINFIDISLKKFILYAVVLIPTVIHYKLKPIRFINLNLMKLNIKKFFKIIDIYYFLGITFLIIKASLIFPLDGDTIANYSSAVKLYINSNSIIDTTNWIGTFGRFTFMLPAIIGHKFPIMQGTFINSLIALSGIRIFSEVIGDIFYKFRYLNLIIFSIILGSNGFNITYFYTMKNDPINIAFISFFIYLLYFINKSKITNKNFLYLISSILGCLSSITYSNVIYLPCLILFAAIFLRKIIPQIKNIKKEILLNISITIIFLFPTYFHNIFLYDNPVFPFSITNRTISKEVSILGNAYYENEIPKFALNSLEKFFSSWWKLMHPYNYVENLKEFADPLLFLLINLLMVITLLNLIRIVIYRRNFLKVLSLEIILLVITILNFAIFMQKQSILRYNLPAILLIVFISSYINYYIINFKNEDNLKSSLINKNKRLKFLNSFMIAIICMPFALYQNSLRFIDNCLNINKGEKINNLFSKTLQPIKYLPSIGLINERFRIKDWRTDISDICTSLRSKPFDLKNNAYQKLDYPRIGFNGRETINYLNKYLPKNSTIIIDSILRGLLRNDIRAHNGMTSLALFSSKSLVPNPSKFLDDYKLWLKEAKRNGIEYIIYNPQQFIPAEEFMSDKVTSDILLLKKISEEIDGIPIPGGSFLISLDEIK